MDSTPLMQMVDPATLVLPSDEEQVKRFLTFHDRQVQFQLARMRHQFHWRNNDPDGYRARQEELKAQQQRCLVSYLPDGRPVTYSGLWKDLQTRFGWGYQELPLDMPDPRPIPWAKVPSLRYYQDEAVDALMRTRHGGIELPTGSGKSHIIMKIAHDRPVKTVVVAPLAGIADQLYRGFLEHFGQRYVGKYGDGSKKFDKLFTIAVAQSLVRLSPGDAAYKELSKANQIIWDEAHTTPAETFDNTCNGLFRHVPYRYFVSATMLRTDGAEMILKGITGPIVYRKSFRELVSEGFLAKPRVRIFEVPSYGATDARDVKVETRRQLYQNPHVLQNAAKIAAKMVAQGRPTLILVEEFRQFSLLKNYMGIPFRFAHGGASQDAKEFLPAEYHKCDIQEIVEDFNSGKANCVIGTSAISTGVDLQRTGCLIYLQGGISEVKVRQAIGRGTRVVPGKEDFFLVDFKVRGSDAMQRHGGERCVVYRDITDDFQEVSL